MKQNTKNNILLILIFLMAIVILIILFFKPLMSIVSADDDVDKKQEATTEEAKDDPASRDYVFMTYSPDKGGEYFFFEDCYSKAEEAVAAGRAESIIDYVYDTDFDKEALTKAQEAVTKGEAESVLDYMRKHDDSGKMAFLLYYDPMYASAWGCYLDQMGVTGDNPILSAEQDLSVELRPDAATQRFIDNPEDWEDAITRIEDILWDESNTIELKELDNYTSGMYAVKDGVAEGIPSVVVRETTNAGGHFICITYKGTELKFRLECGYQPVDIPNWTPSGPSVPDNPKTPETPKTPPELESKEPKNDPMNNTEAPNYDYYEPDPTSPRETSTEQTKDPEPEKNNPSEYKAPETPTEEPAATQPSDGTEVDPKNDSNISDDTDGKTETTKDGKSGEVTADDDKDNGNFNDNVNDNKNPAEDGYTDGSTPADDNFTAPE